MLIYQPSQPHFADGASIVQAQASPSQWPSPSMSVALQEQFDRSICLPRTEDIKFGTRSKVQRSHSFAYGSLRSPSASTKGGNNRLAAPQIYCAMLSRVAQEWRNRLTIGDLSVGDRIKNGIVYKNSFYGREAVDLLMTIMGRHDRHLALQLGQALGAQRLFRDVDYEIMLADKFTEVFQHDDQYLPMEPESMATTSICNNDNASELLSPSDTKPTSAATMLADGPTGIFTPLTDCYAPTCYSNIPCYSLSCPKRRLRRLLSQKAQSGSAGANKRKPSGMWSDNAPSSVMSISKTERKRQESIYELILTETQFVKDLDYVQEMWIRPLQQSNVIPDEKHRLEFIEKVFLNIVDIHTINVGFAEALRARQDKESTLVHQIGDVVLRFVNEFEPFIEYGERQFEANFYFEQECRTNAEFRAFRKSREFHEASQKLELNAYLTKPTTRLGRYTLLLCAVLDYTPEKHVDHKDLSDALNVIKDILRRLNSRVGAATNRFKLSCLHNELLCDETYREDIELEHSDRKIVMEGTLRKGTVVDSNNYNVILLDNALLFGKTKFIKGTKRIVIKRQPIPIDFLRASSPEHKLVRRSSSILPHLRHSVSISADIRAGTDSVALSPARKKNYAIYFSDLGRGGNNLTLYVYSAKERQLWIEAIHNLQKERRPALFELVPTIQAPASTGKVNHMITFNGGKQYLLATDNGVYVGHVADENEPRQVLALDNVTQVHVIESSALLLVLANKVLYEYSLSTVNGKPEDTSPGLKIRTNVPFFHVGQVANSHTVVCVLSHQRESKITLYVTSSKSPVALVRRRTLRNILGSRPSELHLKCIKKIYMPCEARSISLTQSKLLVNSTRGMIMIDLQSDSIQAVLDATDDKLEFITRYERESAQSLIRHQEKHISVFCEGKNHNYLMCYNEYAFYIDKNGKRAHPNFLIEWKGSPQAFAFMPPYVIAFERSFIEIRDLFKGELVQVIQGDELMCLNNGDGIYSAQVHGVMSKNNGEQCIFNLELIPKTTLPPP